MAVAVTANNSVEYLLGGKSRDLGEFTVLRTLPAPQRQRVGPFIFFDHFGPAQFEPGHGVDVRPHPHIGIATITYLFEGQILHRDSLGHAKVITSGAVNWMTAGRGIVHSERTPPELKASGSPIHGLQSWVALPIDQEESEPGFDHYPAEQVPTVEQSGGTLRVIAGEAFGARSPVRTASETIYVECRLDAGATIEIPIGYDEIAVYAVEGEMTIDGMVVAPGTMAVLSRGAAAAVNASTKALCMLLGGATLEGDRTLWWNFVSSSRERLEQAKRDWRQGRFDAVPGESEFIPLPD